MFDVQSILCDRPNQGECIQHSYLVAVPTTALFLLSPLLIYKLRQSKNGSLSPNSPISLRIVLNVVQCIVVASLFVYGIYEHLNDRDRSRVELIYPLPLCLSLFLALVLQVACQRFGIITSGVLFIYWLLLAVCGVPEFRKVLEVAGNDILNHPNRFLFGVNYVLVCIQLFLSCFADKLRDHSHSDNKSPELKSSFLNQITFRWFDQMIWKGFRAPLTTDDLWDLNEGDTSLSTVSAFNAHWNETLKEANRKAKKQRSEARETDREQLLESAKSRPSLLIPLLKTYKYAAFGVCGLKFFHDVLVFFTPHLLSILISFIEDTSQPLWMGVAIAIAMFVTNLFQSFLEHQVEFVLSRVAFNMSSALISAVYSKAMRLSQAARRNRTIGEIVNLMTVDVESFEEMCTFSMYVWSSPVLIVVALVFLYDLLGLAALVGFGTLVITIPINVVITQQMDKVQEERMKVKDERVKLMSEVLNGIKVIKFQAWEESMQNQISAIRRREVALLRRCALLNAAQSVSWTCTPFLVSTSTLGSYVLFDPENNVLTPEITFVAIAYLNIIRFPLACCAMILGKVASFMVSNRRMKAYMGEEEVDEYVQTNKHPDSSVVISNGNFSWGNNDEAILKGFDLAVKKGDLIAVVGKVGSGKSSLLSAILGEMTKKSGEVNVDGSVAYVSQQAWIQNATLEDNITFGKLREEKFYRRVIETCALKPDLATLAAGDQTEIGEKGINLSGGQKQRVNLARAVYSQNDIFLLDDPLSAVDSHVAKHLFESVISSQTGILKGKTRILVTHGLGFLKHCDRIVVLKDGGISEMGSYKELIANQGAFADFLEEYLMEEAEKRRFSAEEPDEDLEEVLKELDDLDPATKQRFQTQMSVISRQESVDTPMGVRRRLTSTEAPKNQEEDKKKAKLIDDEEVESGHVKFRIYLGYFRSIGLLVIFFFFVAYALASAFGVVTNLWLAKWTDMSSAKGNGTTVSETMYSLGIFSGLGLLQSLFGCCASVSTALAMLRGSKIIHEGLLKNVLRLPMAFFDATPIGRILNRFAKDIEATDHELPSYVDEVIYSLCDCVATIAVITCNTVSLIPVIGVLFILYAIILVFYVRTSRQLQRLQSKTRSPIYSHFQESLQGVQSIRAYNCVDRFVRESQKKVDANVKCHYPIQVATGWFAVRLELIGNLIILFAALFAVFFRESSSVTAGFVGLSISYALTITQSLNYFVRMASGMEAHIVSVERIKEYASKPREDQKEVKDVPPKQWPESGTIEIEDLKLRYRAGLDLVLNGISAKIASGEKIGIVGRTGAGKSSLTLALFRIVEAEAGRILIDGRDISQMGLTELRSRLTIVPQDPVLFSGTLRMNLDPFGEFSDDAIWESLGAIASLRQFISESLAGGLEHHIAEGGDNLSVGQRQLICLSRALLHRSRILVLDEAAAALDVETDALIQATIRDNFKHATVLTIAHRLNTVIDYDRILVLERGQIAEFDSPKNLLAQPNSIFYSMAREAGIV